MSSASLASLSASLSAESLAWAQRKPLGARKQNVDLAVLRSMHIKKWNAKRETEHRRASLFALSVMFLSGLGNLTALPHGYLNCSHASPNSLPIFRATLERESRWHWHYFRS